MKEIGRRDFLKTSGTIAGAVAVTGFPGILRARTKTAVAIVQSNQDVGSSLTFDLSVWGNDTAKSQKELGMMEVGWTDESMAEIETMVRKACRLAGGLPVQKGDTVLVKPNVVQTPHLGFFLLDNYSTARAMATISDPRVVSAFNRAFRSGDLAAEALKAGAPTARAIRESTGH